MHHAAHRKTVVLTHPPKKRCFGRSNLSVALGLALFSPGAFSTTLTLGGTIEDSAHAEDYPGVDALVMTGGQWHLYGALVGGTGTSNIKTGARTLLNGSDNLGSGLVTMEGGTLQADGNDVVLDNLVRLQPAGMIVDGPRADVQRNHQWRRRHSQARKRCFDLACGQHLHGVHQVVRGCY